MSYVYIFICKEDVVLEHANVKCHLCTLWWTCETCKGKLSKHRSKGNFKLLMIYMNTENPEIQKPYESLRSSLQLAWISSLCYFQPLQMVQNGGPRHHSTSDINFCCTKSCIPSREEICGEKRDKDSNENFGILMIHMKSGELEIWDSNLPSSPNCSQNRKNGGGTMVFKMNGGRFRDESEEALRRSIQRPIGIDYTSCHFQHLWIVHNMIST